MASMMGVISGPGLAPYSACKSGMIGLTKVCKICVFSSEVCHDCHFINWLTSNHK